MAAAQAPRFLARAQVRARWRSGAERTRCHGECASKGGFIKAYERCEDVYLYI